MVATEFLSPLIQIGREIRIEVAMSVAASPLGHWQRRASEPPALLPEQRLDDRSAVERRKAEALLQSVRTGSVRR
jgi:hypothetical protein